MIHLIPFLALFPLILAQKTCSKSTLSCSNEGTDPCCSPYPGGVFLFKQRFEADLEDPGSWGIDGLDVYTCDGNQIPPTPSAASPQSYTQEEIHSFILRSPLYGSESVYEGWENDWTRGEVGEGLEEVWERSWATGGKLVSTLRAECLDGYERGEEVPMFFDTMHHLHAQFDPSSLLARSGIVPSDKQFYSKSQILDALKKGEGEGYEPLLTCQTQTLSTIHWPLLVRGKFQDKLFSAATVQFDEAVLSGGREGEGICPDQGIFYPPIENSPPPSPSHTWEPIPSHSATSTQSGTQETKTQGFDEHENRVNVEKLGFRARVEADRGDGGEEMWAERRHEEL